MNPYLIGAVIALVLAPWRRQPLQSAEGPMPQPNRGGWKTCSRGHKYRGLDFCPK